MRKLNSKNKAYIVALSALVAIVGIIVILFIVYKIKDINIKYDISKGSVVFNSDNELVTFSESTYAKKNLIGSYYALENDKKVNITSNPVIYNKNNRIIKLLGTFYEIKDNGETSKIKGETDIENTISSRIFKISDRKYLIISDTITSSDGSLNTKDYLIINIDKKGNGYLYNYELHMKSFNDLVINTSKFSLKVNSEKLTMGSEVIDLAKINGSTNEYQEKNETNTTNNGGANPNNDMDNLYPTKKEKEEVKEEVIKQIEIDNKYVTRKTSILSVNSSVNSVDIHYVVYDPFNEYTRIYVILKNNDEVINTYDLDRNIANFEIKNLLSNTEYLLEFHYNYLDSNNITQDVIFDSVKKTTSTLKGNISLEKVTSNSVSYIVKIEDGIKLESCHMALYIDDNLVSNEQIDTSELLKAGYHGKITYEQNGNFATLKLINCIYNGKEAQIDASYKYKL